MKGGQHEGDYAGHDREDDEDGPPVWLLMVADSCGCEASHEVGPVRHPHLTIEVDERVRGEEHTNHETAQDAQHISLLEHIQRRDCHEQGDRERGGAVHPAHDFERIGLDHQTPPCRLSKPSTQHKYKYPS